MAPTAEFKLVNIASAVLLLVVFTADGTLSYDDTPSLTCLCDPVPKNFDEAINDTVSKDCRKCFVFTYNFTSDQVSVEIIILAVS